MNKKHRGHAIVINHYKFRQSMFTAQRKERTGTDVDRNRLYNTLTQLGFSVTICEDLTAEKISDKLKEGIHPQFRILKSKDMTNACYT